MIFLYNSLNELVGVNCKGYNFYYLKNAMGDIMGFVDEYGNYVEKNYLSTWGDFGYGGSAVTQSGNCANYSATIFLSNNNPMGYRGYYLDQDLGFFYLQSRYYVPTWHRFFNADLPKYAKMQKDDSNGTNLFAYCGNDPVNNVDYEGYAYNPSKAQAYADRWWYSRNTSSYKTNSADCANFVSQCLYAGKLSNMTNEWYHRIYYYNTVYMGMGNYKREAVYGNISNAWGVALELGKWLYRNFANKNNNRFYYITDLKTLNSVGKKLSTKKLCSAVILLEWYEDNKTHYHIMISGKVQNKNGTYHIYTYGHTNDRDGKVTNGKYASMQDFLNDSSKKKKIIRVYFLN